MIRLKKSEKDEYDRKKYREEKIDTKVEEKKV